MAELTQKQRESMRKLFEDNGLDKDDVFTHKHYVIIKRSGIEKIEAHNKIRVTYEAVKVEPEFCVIKAIGTQGNITRETFASAQYGGKQQNEQGKWVSMGTTDSRYVMEIAEKRALSRVILKICNLYEMGIFGEDEGVQDEGLD